MNYVSTSIPVVLLIFKENLVLIDYEYLNSCITDEEIVDYITLITHYRLIFFRGTCRFITDQL